MSNIQGCVSCSHCQMESGDKSFTAVCRLKEKIVKSKEFWANECEDYDCGAFSIIPCETKKGRTNDNP